jgi:endoglucanase
MAISNLFVTRRSRLALIRSPLAYVAIPLVLIAAGCVIYQGIVGIPSAARSEPGNLVRDDGPITNADWTIFKARFIKPDGRLVDSRSHLTHSEGQGYAMLLALAAKDRATFDSVWNWTRHNMRRDDDALLAWKWQPDDKGGGAVADSNDAADADILIAWALHRAARQWQDSSYDEAAVPIAHDILEKLVREVGGVTVLMPGRDGFDHDDGVTINLSYWIYPALPALNKIAPSVLWRRLEQSGLYLTEAARFGHAQLPSDWVKLAYLPRGGVAIEPAQDQPVFGYDAVRIPLYMLWGGKASPEAMAPFLAYWQAAPNDDIPATVNLVTGDATPYPISPGMRAIVTAIESRAAAPGENRAAMPMQPSIDPDHDYYSAALELLVRLALSETS